MKRQITDSISENLTDSDLESKLFFSVQNVNLMVPNLKKIDKYPLNNPDKYEKIKLLPSNCELKRV